MIRECRGQFIREVPILSQIGPGGAVVDLEQVALGSQQIETKWL